MMKLFFAAFIGLAMSTGAFARCLELPGEPQKGSRTNYSPTCKSLTDGGMYATGGGVEFILPFKNEQAAIDHWTVITSRPTQSGRGWMCRVGLMKREAIPAPPKPKYFCWVQCCN